MGSIKSDLLYLSLFGGAFFIVKQIYCILHTILKKNDRKLSLWKFDKDVSATDCLSRVEATYRSITINQVEYHIILWVKNGATYDGQVEIIFNYKTQNNYSQGVFIDFSGAYIRKLWMNGKVLGEDFNDDVDVEWRAHRIHISKKLLRAKNKVFISYTNDYQHSGVGFHQFMGSSEQEEFFYTNTKQFAAHKIFPCFDQPDIKAKFQLTVVAPIHCYVLSCSPVIETRKEFIQFDHLFMFSETLKNHNDYTSSPSVIEAIHKGMFKIWIFQKTKPLSSCHFFIAVGPFYYVERTLKCIPSNGGRKTNMSRNFPLKIFYRKHDSLSIYSSHMLKSLFYITDEAHHYFEKYLNSSFPFEKLDLILLPFFSSSTEPMVFGGTIVISDTDTIKMQEVNVYENRLNNTMNIFSAVCTLWLGVCTSASWWSEIWLYEAISAYLSARALCHQNYECFLEWILFGDEKNNTNLRKNNLLISFDTNHFDKKSEESLNNFFPNKKRLNVMIEHGNISEKYSAEEEDICEFNNSIHNVSEKNDLNKNKNEHKFIKTKNNHFSCSSSSFLPFLSNDISVSTHCHSFHTLNSFDINQPEEEQNFFKNKFTKKNGRTTKGAKKNALNAINNKINFNNSSGLLSNINDAFDEKLHKKTVSSFVASKNMSMYIKNYFINNFQTGDTQQSSQSNTVMPIKSSAFQSEEIRIKKSYTESYYKQENSDEEDSFKEDALSWLWFHINLKELAYIFDQKITSYPVCYSLRTTNSIMPNVAVTKGKGAAVIKQLVCIMGHSFFIKNLRKFLLVNKWKSKSIKAFFESMLESCEKFYDHFNFRLQTQWIRMWLGKPGVNTIKPVCTNLLNIYSL